MVMSKPLPKEGFEIFKGIDLKLNCPFMPIDAFEWDTNDCYWKFHKASDKINLFRYYAVPKHQHE